MSKADFFSPKQSPIPPILFFGVKKQPSFSQYFCLAKWPCTTFSNLSSRSFSSRCDNVMYVPRAGLLAPSQKIDGQHNNKLLYSALQSSAGRSIGTWSNQPNAPPAGPDRKDSPGEEHCSISGGTQSKVRSGCWSWCPCCCLLIVCPAHQQSARRSVAAFYNYRPVADEHRSPLHLLTFFTFSFRAAGRRVNSQTHFGLEKACVKRNFEPVRPACCLLSYLFCTVPWCSAQSARQLPSASLAVKWMDSCCTYRSYWDSRFLWSHPVFSASADMLMPLLSWNGTSSLQWQRPMFSEFWSNMHDNRIVIATFHWQHLEILFGFCQQVSASKLLHFHSRDGERKKEKKRKKDYPLANQAQIKVTMAACYSCWWLIR